MSDNLAVKEYAVGARRYGFIAADDQLNESLAGSKVANQRLEKSESDVTKAQIEAKKQAIEKNPNAFNGLKAVLAIDDETGELTLFETDYATYATFLSKDSKFNRGFFPVGVAVNVTTADGQLVVGNREKSRKSAEKNNQPCPYQTPCGFVDVETSEKDSAGKDVTIFDKIKSGESDLIDILQFNAKKELEEELIPLHLLGEENAQLELQGFITSPKTWIEADGTERKVHVVKTAAFGLRLEKTTAQDLLEKRETAIAAGQVKDAKSEMPEIAFVSPDQLDRSISKLEQEGEVVTVKGGDGRKCPMIAEHSCVLASEAQYRDRNPQEKEKIQTEYSKFTNSFAADIGLNQALHQQETRIGLDRMRKDMQQGSKNFQEELADARRDFYGLLQSRF